MHFVVEQVSRDAAKAAAERLVQLPPEALSGLSLTEMTLVRNFAVPADGSSVLSPLPPLTGVVSGRVLASDEATTAYYAAVYLKSDHILFGRAYQVNTDASGQYTLSSNLSSNSPTIGIPLDSFTLKSRVYTGGAIDSPVLF